MYFMTNLSSLSDSMDIHSLDRYTVLRLLYIRCPSVILSTILG